MVEAPSSRNAIKLSCTPAVCWAAEHSGIPLIRELSVQNYGEERFENAHLSISLQPDLSETLDLYLPCLEIGESHHFGHVDFRLPPGKLRQIVELERGEFLICLFRGGDLVGELREPVEILPCNQWPGMGMPTGLLTTFILPNHPAIARILKRTSDRLQEIDESAAIIGYQGKNPKSVRAQVVALFQTLQSLGLSYIGTAASFEKRGQKIRLPDIILRDQLANCLDMTLLAAACLEQMDLRPLVIFIEGHAFPGVWLTEDRFPEGEVQDAARIRTQIALGNILVWDSSATMAQPPASFGQVQSLGEKHLVGDDTFQFALDVRVMRLERFLPLPLRESVQESNNVLQTPTNTAPKADELQEILSEARQEGALLEGNGLPQITRAGQGRWQRWKDRLLDLSLRNRLLNFRPSSQSALPLEVPDIAKFEDLLADHRTFDLLPKPPQDSRDARDLRLLAQREDADLWKAQRLADLNARILHSNLTPGDFIGRGKELEQLARTDLEEGGVCTVFAAIGMLRWFEPGVEKERFAPLLLYPVQILFNRQLRRIGLQRLPEDPIPNVTLVEKMRRDYNVDLGFLGSLEPDDSGVDIVQMLRRCREAIQRIPRWEVLEEVHLGHFTFAKFLMWKDLEDNAEILLKNPVVRHIALEDSDVLGAQPEQVSVESLEALPPGHLPCVVDADSTQLSAVASAMAGRSFVLQGPPGTGKSQTIANIIACALAKQRSVLFVSEKMAALEVVHARLRQAGLEDFCLELHSHKAHRKGVLESFQRVMERGKRIALDGWEIRESELQGQRNELNAYVEALHRSRSIGFSLFEGSARAHELRGLPGVSVDRGDLDSMDAETYRSLLDAAEAFAHRARAIEPLTDCPWQGTDPGSWSHTAQDLLRNQILTTRRVLESLHGVLKTLELELKIDLPAAPEGLEWVVAGLTVLAETALPEMALNPSTWTLYEEDLNHYRMAIQALAKRTSALEARWLPLLLENDLRSALTSYQRHASSFPAFRWLRLWGARAWLKPMARSPLAKPFGVLGDLEEAVSIQTERTRLNGVGALLMKRLKPAPWEKVDVIKTQVLTLHQSLRMLYLHMPEGSAARLMQSLWSLLPDRRKAHEEALTKAWKDFCQSETELFDVLGLKAGIGEMGWSSPAHFARLVSEMSAWEAGLSQFKAWSFYRETARALESMNLGEVVKAHKGGVPSEQLVCASERALLERWSAGLRDQEPALRGFDGSHHHRKVAQFRDLDHRWISLCRSFVLRHLESRLPVAAAGVAEGSEMGILLRETKKKTRHLAIRKLLQSIPTLLPRLKPCLLMSPISVAQYLPADGKPFDLLVFDEASQITTHDAIGTLARGNQVVVVGDSRQLPPTSFFSRNMDEEENVDDNDVTELESILDEAVAKQLPQQLLGWHYRSRHHSLIDFSNRHYYDNRLHVFPAAVRKVEDLGIAWHPVSAGIYYSAGCEPRALERTNPIEATHLVDHLVQRLRRTPFGTRSFGIVTFSLSQQRLIKALLDERRAKFPEIEPHFHGPEDVFIKNLENVQGDERDEILFSIGYARDQKGRLRMHFGPLSIAGGERRLNVAITRARCQLRIFSTLTHDQIDLGRTSARGAEHLKDFLQFAAQQGGGEIQEHPPARFASPFEREICQSVESLGYQVDTQVGCGGYRIDLAIVDPSNTGRYLLGIECDGPSYRSALTARDRDRLRHQVLEGLGWRLLRVWSPDWVEDQAREVARIKEAIEASQTQMMSEINPKGTASGGVKPLLEPQNELTIYNAAPRVAGAMDAYSVMEPTSLPASGNPYVEAILPIMPAMEPEQFYAHGSESLTRTTVLNVLASEAPLHRDDLDGKIIRAYGWSALTKRGRGRMDGILRMMAAQKEVRCLGSFVWQFDQDPSTYDGFRSPSPRDAEHIPPEEIANAMATALQANIAMEEDALLREAALLFGFRRVTEKTTQAFRAGLPKLLAKADFQKEGASYQLR